MSFRMMEMLMLFVAGMTTIGCATGILVAIIRRVGKKPAVSPDLTLRLDEIADRLARLEPAIDSMSVEIERISEAQRFTAKVLSQRSVQPDTPPMRAGSNTPH